MGLCTTCSGTLIYDEELMPRAPNEEELRELDQHEEMASLRKYLANYQAWKRSRLN